MVSWASSRDIACSVQILSEARWRYLAMNGISKRRRSSTLRDRRQIRFESWPTRRRNRSAPRAPESTSCCRDTTGTSWTSDSSQSFSYYAVIWLLAAIYSPAFSRSFSYSLAGSPCFSCFLSIQHLPSLWSLDVILPYFYIVETLFCFPPCCSSSVCSICAVTFIYLLTPLELIFRLLRLFHYLLTSSFRWHLRRLISGYDRFKGGFWRTRVPFVMISLVICVHSGAVARSEHCMNASIRKRVPVSPTPSRSSGCLL